MPLPIVGPTAGSPRLATLFAQNLLVARLTRAWTQQALASASGVSRATIAQLEAGTGDPKLSTVEHLATALEVSSVVLLLGRRELQGLVRLTEDSLEPALVENPTVNTMRHLVSSGFVRSRLEAAHLGISLARQFSRAQLGEQCRAPADIGAAIRSFHLPGAGTLAGAAFSERLVAGSVGAGQLAD